MINPGADVWFRGCFCSFFLPNLLAQHGTINDIAHDKPLSLPSWFSIRQSRCIRIFRRKSVTSRYEEIHEPCNSTTCQYRSSESCVNIWRITKRSLTQARWPQHPFYQLSETTIKNWSNLAEWGNINRPYPNIQHMDYMDLHILPLVELYLRLSTPIIKYIPLQVDSGKWRSGSMMVVWKRMKRERRLRERRLRYWIWIAPAQSAQPRLADMLSR